MKVSSSVTKVIPKFEPIELRVLIESEQELCDLWLRHNLSGKSVDKENGCYLKYRSSEIDDAAGFVAKLWKTLDNYICQRNLKTR